ncbi:hypothetical protein I4U23_016800 [Adineta vaga]|nr:hypothetical protein I4U23_016800 [Adineta vaga]
MWFRSILSSVKHRDVSSYRRLHSYNMAVMDMASKIAKIGSAGKSLAGLCGASWIFLLLAILIQMLHYRIWWHYLPSYELEKKNPEPLSKKHKRYIPHHLLGNNRTMKLGDRSCDNDQECNVRSMEHILIFHRDVYTPQPRWSEVRKREMGVGVCV